MNVVKDKESIYATEAIESLDYSKEIRQEQRKAESLKWFNKIFFKKRDFPGGAVIKNPPANAGDTGSSPCLGRSHMPQSN